MIEPLPHFTHAELAALRAAAYSVKDNPPVGAFIRENSYSCHFNTIERCVSSSYCDTSEARITMAQGYFLSQCNPELILKLIDIADKHGFTDTNATDGTTIE